jgi:O-antigen ligase
LMGTAAIISGSRSGVISLVAAVIFLAVLATKSGRPNRRIVKTGRLSKIGPIAIVSLTSIAGVLWIGAAEIVDRFGNAVDAQVRFGTPDVGRSAIWRDTLKVVRDYPILGAGLGSYETIYPSYADTEDRDSVDYAHNDYLQVAAEAGVVGSIIAVCFIVVIFSAMYRGIQSPDPLLAGLSLAAGAGIVAVLAQSLSDTDVQIPSNALLFLVLSAIVSRAQEPAKENG